MITAAVIVGSGLIIDYVIWLYSDLLKQQKKQIDNKPIELPSAKLLSAKPSEILINIEWVVLK